MTGKAGLGAWGNGSGDWLMYYHRCLSKSGWQAVDVAFAHAAEVQRLITLLQLACNVNRAAQVSSILAGLLNPPCFLE